MKKYTTKTVLILLTASILIVCCSPKSAQEPVTVALNPYVSRLVTVDAVAGADTLHLIFDTGGGETFISPKVARRLGQEPFGRGVGYRMSGEQVTSQHCNNVTLTIGGIPFRHELIGVWDIQSVLPENLPPVDGVLSLKTFHNQPITLDLANKRLILETPRSLANRTRNMTRLKSRLATGPSGSELSVFVHGKIREPGWFLLDSGNLDVVIVSSHLDPDSAMHSSTKWEAELKLDSLPPVKANCRSKDIIYDGAISEEFMHNWIFTFDLSSNEVWAAPAEKSSSGSF